MTNKPKAREFVAWHYSPDGKRARKNYEAFHSLLKEAIENAPSTVKFTSPDIEKLEKALTEAQADNASLKDQLQWSLRNEEKYKEHIRELGAKIERLRSALKPFAQAYRNNDLTFDWSNCGKVLSEALTQTEGDNG